MTEKKSTEIVSEIVELLTPVNSEERIRIIQASLMLLGENLASGARQRNAASDEFGEDEANGELPPRARAWAKQNNVTFDELQQVFHFDGENVEVIAAEIPGPNRKEKTYNAYILTGLAKLLATGDASFDDKSARTLCESSGCYDQANHSTTIKARTNEFTGTKDKGWKLTAPGLKRAATMIKEMTKA